MELRSLYTVKKIIETGNYQKAAMALNYAQSTITFQIRQLENELGIRLFEKSGNRMFLSDEGKKILPLIEQVIASVDELLSFKATANLPGGSLRIALPETLAVYKMQPVLKAFKKAAPNVRLFLQVLNCYAIYDHLLNRDIDIAIHYDIKKYPQNIETIDLCTYPLVMVASPQIDDTLADLITPDQQKPITHIQNDPNALYLKILDKYLKEKSISLETGMEVWSVEAVKQSVISGLGIAYLPRFAAEQELHDGLLRECPMDANGEMTALCAYHKNKINNPAIRLFLDILCSTYNIG